MSFLMFIDTILWGNDIHKRSATRPKKPVNANRNVPPNNKKLQ